MDIVIHGQNVDITPRLQSYVERKVEKLDRYLPNIVEVQVDLEEEKASRNNDRQIAQITLRHARGSILRAEERTTDMFVAVDAVVDKMYRQIERYKGKRKRKGGGGNSWRPDYPAEAVLHHPDVRGRSHRAARTA